MPDVALEIGSSDFEHNYTLPPAVEKRSLISLFQSGERNGERQH